MQREMTTALKVANVFSIITLILTFWLVLPIIGFVSFRNYLKGKNNKMFCGIFNIIGGNLITGIIVLVNQEK